MRKIGQAFTLIELMIVVAIIGILAAIAVPNFVKFQCRSKQSEARGNLKSMYVAQESFRADFDYYQSVQAITSGAMARTASNSIGWTPKGDKIRYNYSADASSAQTGQDATFSGIAKGGSADTNEMIQKVGGTTVTDTWTVTEENDVCNSAIVRPTTPCNPTDRTLLNACR
jgi:type IV pilus assembly protein PilA